MLQLPTPPPSRKYPLSRWEAVRLRCATDPQILSFCRRPDLQLQGVVFPRSPGTHIVGPWVRDSINSCRDLRTGTQCIGNWGSMDSIGPSPEVLEREEDTTSPGLPSEEDATLVLEGSDGRPAQDLEIMTPWHVLDKGLGFTHEVRRHCT